MKRELNHSGFETHGGDLDPSSETVGTFKILIFF